MMRTHVLLGLSVLSVLSACSNEKPQAKGPNAVDVMVMTVQPTDAPARFQFVGQTESSQQVEIRARVSGFLERRVYQEGSSVKAGQVLFEIDKKPFLAQLQAAKAELAQQQARLLVAKQNLARVKPLAQENALSQKDLDDATGQEQGAAAAVEAAKANVINAELNLGYCTITSPVSGLSSFAKLQDGTYVDPQNSLLTYVAKLDPMRVNFSLSENEALRFKEQVALCRDTFDRVGGGLLGTVLNLVPKKDMGSALYGYGYSSHPNHYYSSHESRRDDDSRDRRSSASRALSTNA